ncbi:MAG: ATP-binding protein [Deltaproteobacteria bacterium]|nr:ATP-binding protein [Deltaproteobacteria bacterium]
MPHLRQRLALAPLRRLAKLWPVVGLVGLRQVGKSTLIRDLLNISNFVTFDDDDSRTDAENSPKVFLAKYARPFAIDEVQKVTKIFDALKSEVDKKRVPGTFYISGSQRFSAGELTRESLTGRIGTLRLFPLTLREGTSTVNLDSFVKAMQRGGLPVPMFLRDADSRRLYWDSWLETTMVRDLSRSYGKGYDLDFAWVVLNEISGMLKQGAYPEISLFSKDSRKVTRYLKAMENIFLVNRLPCHPAGTGRDFWLMGDSGLVTHLLQEKCRSEPGTLILARHFIYNEIVGSLEYQLKKERITYFKSARGEPVDFVIGKLPVKIISKSSGALGWDEKGVAGSMKKLGSSQGLLLAPIDKSDRLSKKGISRMSWLHFS